MYKHGVKFFLLFRLGARKTVGKTTFRANYNVNDPFNGGDNDLYL